MKLEDILSRLPACLRVSDARQSIRQLVNASGKRIAVIDDDPTGTQTVYGVRVLMDWSVESLCRTMSSGDSVFYISTNSRGYCADDARTISLEVGRNLRAAADACGVDLILASRSDSTLRGHFPYEVESLCEGLGQLPDGVIIVPAFFEGGRFTIEDMHYVRQPDDEMVPASQTEFATDPTFGFENSDLKLWVEEKTRGAVKAREVKTISLETIRCGGPDAVAEELMKVSGGLPVVFNAASYEDLEVLALGTLGAEDQGKSFAYRCAASWVKVRAGLDDKPLLSLEQMVQHDGPGLVVVGSYVGKTSRQLDSLFASGIAAGVELDVDALVGAGRLAEIDRAAQEAGRLLSQKRSVVIYTSRSTHLTAREGFLDVGKKIMDGLCQMVQMIDVQPSYVLAKGGITSIEVARCSMGIREGYVLGQILPGVPVWRMGHETRWPGVPYVVFPGNVGGDESLREAVSILEK